MEVTGYRAVHQLPVLQHHRVVAIWIATIHINMTTSQKKEATVLNPSKMWEGGRETEGYFALPPTQALSEQPSSPENFLRRSSNIHARYPSWLAVQDTLKASRCLQCPYWLRPYLGLLSSY